MRICMIGSEMAPYAKTGGLGDVTAALAAGLYRLDHDVRAFLPLYSGIDRQRAKLVPVDFLQDLELQTAGYGLRFSIYTIAGTEGPGIYFIDCPILYSRAGLYTNDDDEHLRFILLSRAALECCQRMGWSPDIVQCNDWQSALVPLYLKTIYAWDGLFRNTKSVLSIHNIGYQGVFAADILTSTGLADRAQLFDHGDLTGGRINFLKTGLLYADALTTVSPTYAREICTPEYGMGLDHFLRVRHENLFGILNGVDYDIWSPENDSLIPHPYSASNLLGKGRNKTTLQARFGLRQDPDVPVVGIVSRLVSQKGLALAFDVLPQLIAHQKIQLAVLGSGEYRFEEFFAWLAHDFPTHAGFWRGFNNPLAHLIEAGSDMFLMPSIYEPCGLNQMYSLRYGTVPIVRKTGGLADTVIPHTADDGGTGIVFEHADKDGLSWAMQTALRLYRDRPRWRRMMINGMHQNFSWDSQSRIYERLFTLLARGKSDVASHG